MARVDAFALVEAIRLPGQAQETASGIKKPSCLSALGATVINKLRLQALGGPVKPFLSVPINSFSQRRRRSLGMICPGHKPICHLVRDWQSPARPLAHGSLGIAKLPGKSPLGPIQQGQALAEMVRRHGGSHRQSGFWRQQPHGRMQLMPRIRRGRRPGREMPRHPPRANPPPRRRCGR